MTDLQYDECVKNLTYISAYKTTFYSQKCPPNFWGRLMQQLQKAILKSCGQLVS